ncbi:MAG TPA: 30S ribosomal protein S4 [Candidatus Nanoarchaeia archaeon]|nr:30S ribosomal protein S4 [Candidatus Nanoarchaeia archaeon]
MGDPKRPKKAYTTPHHPWIRERIEEERKLLREYGLKNKKEIWRMESMLRNYKAQAKKLIALRGSQAEKEKRALLEKLLRYGLVKETTAVDPVLDLSLRDILERRLQTQVFKKGFARSPKQARQFITHQHIMVNGKTVSVPSYLLTMQEESLLSFYPHSSLNNAEHAERVVLEKKQKPEKRKPQRRMGGRRFSQKK